MLRRLFHWAALGALLAACAQSTVAPTATVSRAQPAPTASATLLPFPTALPEATPSPASTAQPIFPPVTEADWQLGPTNARVTILEYGDFQ